MPPPPPKRPALPEFPDLGGVYRGKVSGTMGTGCFIEMNGFAKRVSERRLWGAGRGWAQLAAVDSVCGSGGG